MGCDGRERVGQREASEGETQGVKGDSARRADRRGMERVQSSLHFCGEGAVSLGGWVSALIR